MSEATDRVIERLRASRTHWVDLPAGKRIQYLRPPETELPLLRHGVRLEHVIQYVVGWEGYSEALLLGASVGSSDPLPFETALFSEVIRDDAVALGAIAKAIAKASEDYLVKREGIAKNSAPSST